MTNDLAYYSSLAVGIILLVVGLVNSLRKGESDFLLAPALPSGGGPQPSPPGRGAPPPVGGGGGGDGDGIWMILAVVGGVIVLFTVFLLPRFL